MVKARENRVPIMMSDEELKAIDDWRYANRVATRSDAVRRLAQIGLRMNREMPALVKLAVGAIASSYKMSIKSGVLPLDIEKPILDNERLKREYLLKFFTRFVEIGNEVDPLLTVSALDEALKEAERRKTAKGEALVQIATMLRAAVESRDAAKAPVIRKKTRG